MSSLTPHQSTATSHSVGSDPFTDGRLHRAIDEARDYLYQNQRDMSHWVGTLSSSALATAIAVVALRLVDDETYHDRIVSGRAWLICTQNPDGGWGDAVKDYSNINATSLVIGALTFTAACDENDYREELARALARLEAFGGWEAVGDPGRCTLSGPCRTVAALAGILDFMRIKRLRPEVIMLPARVRRTISTTFPAYLSISMLHSARARHPLNLLPTYGRACSRALEWLRRTQGPNGSFEESAFLTSVIIACAYASGRGNLPWLPAAVAFVVESQREDGSWPIDRDLETFDTDMSVLALHEAGLRIPHAEGVRSWLLARQFFVPCFPTSAPPGGWAWAMPSGWPDSDDTAFTILALRKLGVPREDTAIRRGAEWLEGMQNPDGAWPTFVRKSRMPFDHDCPYITGHVLSALHAAGHLERRPKVLRKALEYLARAQRYDGSFPSIWFREATAGTASVIEALADVGLVDHPMVPRARDYLLRSQNDDGGWAGIRYEQASTAEETSWALMALLRCPRDERIDRAVRRGVEWLLAHQREDGTWEEWPIALYYSAMWYSDSYYAVTLPLQALGRARRTYGGS